MRRLAALGTVIVGLQALVVAASQLNTLVLMIQRLADPDPLYLVTVFMSAMPAITALLLGLYLIYNRHYLAAKWFEDDENPVSATAPLLHVGILLFGVWFLISSLWGAANVLGILAQGLILNGDPSLPLVDPLGIVVRLAGPVAQFIIGVGLIRFSPLVSSWVSKAPVAPGPAAPVAASLLSCPACGAIHDSAEYRDDVDMVSCSECGECIELDRA